MERRPKRTQENRQLKHYMEDNTKYINSIEGRELGVLLESMTPKERAEYIGQRLLFTSDAEVLSYTVDQ